MWALSGISGASGQISRGGNRAVGFAVGMPGDPNIWTSLSAEQQTWVVDTLTRLNSLIVKTTGTKCLTWAPAVDKAAQCFQMWFLSAHLGLTKPDGSPVVLRTDGVFDQDTLDALRTTVALVYPKDFPTPFPGTSLPAPVGAAKKGLSTGAMWGIGAVGATALGGIIYAATRGKARRRRRR